MKLYERMNQGENLSWCKPLSNKEGTRIVVVNDGVVIRSRFTVSTPKEFREQGNDIYFNQAKPDYLIEKYGLHYELGCSDQAFLEEVAPFGEYEIVVSTSARGANIKVGRYKDKDSAKYVLRQIMSCITKSREFFFMPDYDGERSMDV